MIRATRYTIVLAAVATLLMGGSSFAQAADRTDHKREVLWQKLEAKTKALDEKFDGVLGVAVFYPAGGETPPGEGGEEFPPASSIKKTSLSGHFLQKQQ